MKVRAGQIWQDKKNGDKMWITAKHHDIYWNCNFERSIKTHKMTEFIIKKYYVCIKA